MDRAAGKIVIRQPQVKDKLKRFELFTRFGEQNLFATVGEAVNAYLWKIAPSPN